MSVDSLVTELAEHAEAQGIAIDGEHGGAVHRFVVANGCPHDKTFFVVFLLTAELADREARRAGYRGQSHRAAALAFDGK